MTSLSSPRLPVTPTGLLLQRLLMSHVMPLNRWDALEESLRDTLTAYTEAETLLGHLVELGLLTPYQYGRIRSDDWAGLLLGNYRVLDKIGAGGMGVVYRAEHRVMQQPLAVKALHVSAEHNRRALDRFFREVQAVTLLKHPNIVVAVDAGEQPGAGPQGGPVPYLVMELVPGTNLEDLVARDGPLPADRACFIAHQIADALTEAHRHDLVHRDIKPGNVIIMADGHAKLFDFGIARLPTHDDRITKYGAQLGTIGYMAPEQFRNARDVDGRADVFGLGATLFYMLTGRDPFDPPVGSAGASRPPRLRGFRSDVPPALEALLQRLLALDPADRVPTADAAMRDLLPFLGERTRHDTRAVPAAPQVAEAVKAAAGEAAGVAAPPPVRRILVVDDQPDIRRVCRIALGHDTVKVEEAGTGPEAIARIDERDYDLILVDMDLPGCSGEQVLKAIRQQTRMPFTKVMMLSGRASGDDLARLMEQGADDFLTKPFSLVQLRSRVKAALHLKDAQDRSETLRGHLVTLNSELERSLGSRDNELLMTRGAMVLAMAKLVEQRSAETGGHLLRMQKYVRILAGAAAATPGYTGRLDDVFIQMLEDCAPLHDIGKLSVPDHVLDKPGRLTDAERLQVQAHTVAGDATLRTVARTYPLAGGFLQMAAEIARSHHERWDGQGYPDRLAGEAIPLAARIVALCDVYDALRSPRVYKPALSHSIAVMTVCDGSPGHFDPGLAAVFRHCAPQFDRVFRENPD